LSNGNDDDDIEVISGVDPLLMAAARDDDSDDRSLTDLVEQPAKVMRIGTMIKQLLEEVRAAPLDEASRSRLREIHATSIRELEEGLAPELREELDRLTLPFTEGSVPSDAELRIAQAQLVGWLEGLFHGIQTALFAQQMAARSQLEQMREQRGLPPGAGRPGEDNARTLNKLPISAGSIKRLSPLSRSARCAGLAPAVRLASRASAPSARKNRPCGTGPQTAAPADLAESAKAAKSTWALRSALPGSSSTPTGW